MVVRVVLPDSPLITTGWIFAGLIAGLKVACLVLVHFSASLPEGEYRPTRRQVGHGISVVDDPP